jgi:signal transduction protein with GAF and PtsI domain
VAPQGGGELQDIVRSVVASGGIASAAIFVVKPNSPTLELTAAAGIEGPALDGLIAAVGNPAHPINRAMADDGPTFDVRPMNPGGPALRSHLPLVALRDGRQETVGVLAVAHELPLTEDQRAALVRLAEAAGARVDPRGIPPAM